MLSHGGTLKERSLHKKPHICEILKSYVGNGISPFRNFATQNWIIELALIELLEGNKKVSEIAHREGLSVNQLNSWKRKFVDNAYLVFSDRNSKKSAEMELVKAKRREERLRKQINSLVVSDELENIHKDTSIIMETLQLILTNMLLDEVSNR